MSKELAGKMAFVTGSILRAHRRQLYSSSIFLAASVGYLENYGAAASGSDRPRPEVH